MIPDEHLSRLKGSSAMALPQSAAKILELSKNPENGPREYALIISADPGLVAQILRFVNSSFFGFRYKISTIQMALSLVSVRTIRNFVLWNAVFSQLPNPQVEPFSLRCTYQDALRRGVFCKIYAESLLSIEADELFIAGLFQDIAMPILAQKWPEEYKRFMSEAQENNKRLSQLEQENFGWNHAEIGAYLIAEWGVGDSIVKGVRNHVNHFRAADIVGQLVNAVVALSALLPSSRQQQWTEADRFFELFNMINAHKSLFKTPKIPTTSLLFMQTDLQYEDLLKIVQIRPPSVSLSDFLQQYSIEHIDNEQIDR